MRCFDIVRFVGGYDEVFEKYFAAMNLPAKKRIDRLTGYTSWYNYFQKIDENIILRDLKRTFKGARERQYIQIDDGYEPFVGDWLDYNGRDLPQRYENNSRCRPQGGLSRGNYGLRRSMSSAANHEY